MSKKNAAPPPSNEVVKYDYEKYKGKGFEGTSKEDFALPFLGVLQSNSPEVTQGNPKFIETARAGMLMNSVTKELVDGAKGITFIPCTTQHVFVEYRPRASGGGFLGVHTPDSDLVKTAKAAAKEFGDYKTDEGNELTETFYMFGLILEKPEDTEPKEAVAIAFSSTKIKVYKRLMQVLRTFKGAPPLFAHRLNIRSIPDKNALGSFFNYALGPAVGNSTAESLIPPDSPLLEQALALSEQVRQGEKGVDHSTEAKPDGATDKVFS